MASSIKFIVRTLREKSLTKEELFALAPPRMQVGELHRALERCFITRAVVRDKHKLHYNPTIVERSLPAMLGR